jgi:tRNA-uridine 2-sulfurtransferase
VRVLAAMSGGVDSAVAAARAVDAGHDVTGVHLALSRTPAALRSGSRGCCSREDAGDAQRAADVLGIPFYVWDVSERFQSDVVDDFVAEYANGRTPNPCVRCNERIKFAAVLDRALALGFDAVVTGHYARRVDGPAGPELHRAVDAAKDQSYVLAVLRPDQLAHALFPLGGAEKVDVRAEAAGRGLGVAAKPDSHDICFVADGDTRGFLRRSLGDRPGRLVDESGATVGAHDGAYGFTIGQRRGLRLGVPASDGRPRYVLDIEPVTGTVTVGPHESLATSVVHAAAPVWCTGAPERSFDARVQLRAHGEQVPAVVEVTGQRVTALLAGPAYGVADGQTLAVYDGTRVVGSATVTTPADQSRDRGGPGTAAAVPTPASQQLRARGGR